MAITYFTRAFTDEEQAKVQQLVARLEQELATPPKYRTRTAHPRALHLPLTMFILFVLILLAQDPKLLHFWCLITILSLAFLWWGYPQRRQAWEQREAEREEQFLATWRPQRKRALNDAVTALENGVVYEANLIADVLVVAGDDDEYFLGFYRVGERLWLCLEDRMDWPVHSEFTIYWHEAKWPHIALSSGKELEIVKPQWDGKTFEHSDISWDDGDFYELTQEGLLAATPQTFRKTYCGNLFHESFSLPQSTP